MRKLILLSIVLLLTGSACQKLRYPQFSQPAFEQYSRKQPAESLLDTPARAVAVPQLIETPTSTMASSAAGLSDLVVSPVAILPVAKKAPESVYTPTRKIQQEQRVASRIQIRKSLSLRKVKSTDEPSSAIPTQSLLFGLLGLILTVVGAAVSSPGLFIVGGLVSLVSLVLGISGLRRIKRGDAPPSSRGMAVGGLVAGGIGTLLLVGVLLFILAWISSSR
jgi:multisubunit Na+/H+ antiporter MnhB subunit